VRNYVGDTLLWDVNLVLRQDEVPKTVLGNRAGWAGPRGCSRAATRPTRTTCIWTQAPTAWRARSPIIPQTPKHPVRGRMTEISRSALFGKLNPIAYRSVEGATVFCKLRGNPYVELVH